MVTGHTPARPLRRTENAKQAALQVKHTMTGQRFFAVVQTFFGITPALVYQSPASPPPAAAPG